MVKGVDFGYGKVSGKTIKEHGYNFVCRYLSHSPGKNITSAEIADFKSNNLRIVLVWETTEARTLQGFSAGVQDAKDAYNLCADLDILESETIEHNCPVLYFACDMDINNSQIAQVLEYFKGVSSILGIHKTGVYGSSFVVGKCFDAGLVQYGWQTSAWSHGEWDDRAQIQQVSYNINLDGVQCDGNEAVQSDFGGF